MDSAAWLTPPVQLTGSRVFTCDGFTEAQCSWYMKRWHFWYIADHVYALPTVAFFMTGIGLFTVGHFISYYVIGLGFPRFRGPKPWRMLIATIRYLSYRGFHVASLGFNSASVGVLLLGLAGTVFFFCMDLIPQPYYWPSLDFGGSPPLGTRSGWLALGCMPFVFATATKTNWITLLTGVSHERLQVFHRWIAYAFFVLALMHTFPFIVYHIRFHDMQMHFKMSLLFYWTGIVALVFQAWLTFASHSAIRHYFIGTGAVYVPCYVYPWLRTCFEYGVRTTAHVKVEDNGFVRVAIPVNFTWEIGQHCFLRFTSFGLTQAFSRISLTRHTRMASLTAPIESGAFPRIPPEIINEFVSKLLLIFEEDEDARWNEISDSGQLKILRLTHRKFADCHYVNKLLFTDIRLEPTRYHLLKLQRGDFSRVATYTRSITFNAYASWDLVLETWDRLILLDTPDRNPDARSDGMTPLMLSHDAYIRDAKEAQRLLEDPNGDLIETWTNVLKMVGSRLENVTLANHIDYKNLYPHESYSPMNWRNLSLEVPDAWTKPHDDMTRRLPSYRNGRINAQYVRQYACAIVAERLFNTVMTCLSASGIAVPSLSMRLHMLGNVECKTIPGWQQLDLSNLKKLEIAALCPEVPFHLMRETAMASFLHSRQKHNRQRIGDMAHDLIEKCHSTVEIFEFCHYFPFLGGADWPTRAATHDLPALQELALSTRSNPRLLHGWLLRMKDLRSVRIAGDHVGGPAEESLEWRHVFDAIRDHPNVSGPDPKGIHFKFDFGFSYDKVVCKDSSIATPREAPGTGKPCYPLEAHLYGDIEFSHNIALREELRDGVSEDEGSDEESEDEDMEVDDESEEEEEIDSDGEEE
ncbi:ferric cupric reductase transmembrane component 7 [Fusarium tjaetaba]|uniref:Ferric cupric reductase transmembrane component 7 n=1 Tax=Fusarium tjaetaba TaxID=1567544 RepID=A0A8H5R7G6_9HYPO|nr:ferric cupric reductase transmembrane component 7 [Fusarium tjaetaba]KAF5627808.1 ferric cupric reductase transmembrane component 7 [Fusarium tjaetaba]